MLEQKSKERRAFMRLVIDAPLTLLFEGRELAGVCRDLSANGMAIELSEALPLGALLQVSLATASNALPPFQAEARVLRCEPDGGAYRLGVEFVSLVSDSAT
ncbi:MAG: PilZ domain-containing protein [Aeromonadaceae bacterium]